MTGTFDRYADLRNNVPGAYQALLYCITHNVCVSGRCIDWLIEEHFELVSDEYYMDFEDSSRWSIGKAYILSLDDGFYRCWEEVGLTEMQPNEYYDQTFECVRMKEVTTTVWVTNEEEDLIYG
jgi:hypothetical protein